VRGPESKKKLPCGAYLTVSNSIFIELLWLKVKAESFSFAVLSTANEKYLLLCDLCGSSEAGG
jgi:hypothetical protein